MRWPSAVLVLTLCLIPAPASAIDVHGDDGADRFVGSGGIVLPAGGGGDRRGAATCADCRWKMTDPCAHMSNPGEEAACLTLPSICAPDGSQLLRAFMSRDAGATWEYLGMFCIPPSGPVTVAHVERVVQETFERSVPPSSIGVQPARGALPHLPVIFDSGQPRSIDSTQEIVGVRVRLHLTASWSWEFGDGGVLNTSSPGSRYPDTAVSHVYRRDGVHGVRLRTTWRASYDLDGLGDFDVPEPVTQVTTVQVPIGQGRAVLVP